MAILPSDPMHRNWDSQQIGHIAQSETEKNELTQLQELGSMSAVNLQNLIATSVALGSAQTLEVLGISSGEISMRKAIKVYGKWFSDAVMRNKIQPCRVESGRAGTKWYRVVDILKAKTEDCARAELIIH